MSLSERVTGVLSYARNRERWLTTSEFKPVDWVPVYLVPTGALIAELAGAGLREYYHDVDTMIQAQRRFIERFHLYDYTVDQGIITEASAFCNIRWPEDDEPWVVPRIKNPRDMEDLEVPDVYRDGLMARAIEIYRMVKRKTGSNPAWPALRGPFTLAALIRGIPQLLTDVYRYPDLVHKLMETCTKTLEEWIDAQLKVSGHCTRNLNDDVTGFLSAELAEKFSFPYIRRLFKKLGRRGSIYHTDSDVMHQLDQIATCGAGTFGYFFGLMPLKDVKAKIGGKICLMGNVPPIEVLVRGSPQDVGKCVKEQISIGARGYGYAVSPGGVMNRGTPPENIYAMVDAVVKYGKYPECLER